MKEHPIIFTGESVRAILAGRKTMTRRVAKLDAQGMLKLRGPYSVPIVHDVIMWTPVGGEPSRPMPPSKLAEYCPFGSVGDKLWCRETWAKGEDFGANGEGPFYRSTDPGWDDTAEYVRWRTPIFMPRWASRITLGITGVKAERLQDISEEDADAEGFAGDVPRKAFPGVFGGDPERWGNYSIPECYGFLWDSINGKRPGCRWINNPWVWVMSFKKLEGKP